MPCFPLVTGLSGSLDESLAHLTFAILSIIVGVEIKC